MESCPRQGNRCTKCLGEAALKMKESYAQRHPELTGEDVDIVVENSGLQVVVEEQGGLELVDSCVDRRARARKIGSELGKRVR